MAEFTPEQEAYLASLERGARKVDPTTNQPPGVPQFNPNVAGYDPQTGEVNKPLDDNAVTAFTTGMNDLPVIGPATKAGVAGGTALLTKGIDTVTGSPDTSTIADRYTANRQNQEQSMLEHPNAAMAGNVAGMALLGSGIPNPATMTGAGMVGGGVGAADTTIRAAARGELPTGHDLFTSTAMGAGGGLIFQGLGRAANDIYTRFGLGDKPMSRITEMAIKQRNDIEDLSGQAMDASGVVIKSSAVNKLATDIYTELSKDGYSRKVLILL